jgi:hypothetical protein
MLLILKIIKIFKKCYHSVVVRHDFSLVGTNFITEPLPPPSRQPKEGYRPSRNASMRLNLPEQAASFLRNP